MQNKQKKQSTFEGMEQLVNPDIKAKLSDKFLVPPFSILDSKQGYWQDRKRDWIALGIESEVGRGNNLLQFSATAKLHPITDPEKAKEWNKQISKREKTVVHGLTFNSSGFMADVINEGGGGTSIFDPVLCELIYRWFLPHPNSKILDPFSGGSVRGIVAGFLNQQYIGIDLSKDQIEANLDQVNRLNPPIHPNYIIGNSIDLNNILDKDYKADFIFSCPPYHDLEKYSDDMDDLSNMSWDSFKLNYNKIITQCILKLENDRFACFVVSEIRNEIGGYKGLVPFTIKCFVDAGARYYNEIILVNVIGSLSLRVSRQFQSRKIGRMHQNILVFYKGDIEQIAKVFPEIKIETNNFGEPND